MASSSGATTGWPAAAAAAAPAGAPSSSSSTQPPLAAAQQPLSPKVFDGSFRSPVKSLQFPRGEVVYLPQLEGNFLGRGLLALLGAYSRKQQLRNGAAVLFQALCEAAESAELQQAVGLEVGSFMGPFNLMSLHMWLIINRLDEESADSKDAQVFRDALYQDFFYKDIERRVFAHGVQIRVGKWVEKLQKQFYGTCFAYDKALRSEGGVAAQQAAFVAALLKNVYNGEPQNKPWAELLARYLCRELACLQQTSAEAIYKGHVRFSFDIVQRST